jgi:hypothetical protein
VKAPNVARAALVILLFSALLVGLPATLAPHAFYDGFPFVRHWVDLLPPYNEHLVTDVGGLYLGFAVLFAWAAWALQPTLARAACAAWLLWAVIHLIFHISHLDPYDTLDAIAQTASLAFLLVPPAIAIWAVGDRAGSKPFP